MKLTLIFLLLCNVCIGQDKMKDTILVEAIVTDTFYRPHAPSYSLRVYAIMQREDTPDCSKCWPTYYVIKYLDENKKPLSKDIIVWQSFSLNKNEKQRKLN